MAEPAVAPTISVKDHSHTYVNDWDHEHLMEGLAEIHSQQDITQKSDWVVYNHSQSANGHDIPLFQGKVWGWYENEHMSHFYAEVHGHFIEVTWVDDKFLKPTKHYDSSYFHYA